MDHEQEKNISCSKLSMIREISNDSISGIVNNQSNVSLIERSNLNQASFEHNVKIEKTPSFIQRKFKRNFSTSSLEDHKNEQNHDIYKSTRRKSSVEKKKFPFWTNQKVKPVSVEVDKFNKSAPVSSIMKEDMIHENKSSIDEDIKLDEISSQSRSNIVKYKILKRYSLDLKASNTKYIDEKGYRNDNDDVFEKSPRKVEHDEKQKHSQFLKSERKDAFCLNPDIFDPRNYAESDSSYISSSENEEVIDCCNHHHFKEKYVNKIFNISVDCIFELLFNSSVFRDKYYHLLNINDISVSEWSMAKNKCKIRKITYNSPKNSKPVDEVESFINVENHILYPESIPGKCYLVDVEFINGGILDNEYFDIINRYCLRRKEETTCQLLISSQLNFKQNVSGSLKKHIEMNYKLHLQESFAILDKLLFSFEYESPKLEAKEDNTRKHNHLRLSTKSSSNKQIGIQKSICSIDVMVRIICAIIILLLIFNAIMYSKLCSLEDLIQDLSVKNHQIQISKTHLCTQHMCKQPIYLSNVDRWKDSISNTIKFIDRLIQTLSQIKTVMNITNDIPL